MIAITHPGELAHGLHAGVPPLVYHAQCVGMASKSALDKIEQSPAHMKSWLDRTVKPTPAMELGSALHMALLEPEDFAASYVVEPNFGDCRFKEAKENRAAWRKEHDGLALLEPDDAEAISGMCASVRAHPKASLLLSGGSPELTIRWRDAATGVECKARADYHRADIATGIDVKTTGDARARSFSYSVVDYRYDVQQIFYSEGFAAVGAPLEQFAFIAVEKTHPYAVAVHVIAADDLVDGTEALRANLEAFAECTRTGIYPAYDTAIQTLALPRRKKAA